MKACQSRNIAGRVNVSGGALAETLGGDVVYRTTIERNPGAWMAHNNLGAELFDAGRLSEAIEHDQRALELKPDYPEAHTNLGNALLGLGRPEEARASFDRALKYQPQDAEANWNLAHVLILTGQNNHNWKAMTPPMKAELEKMGQRRRACGLF